MTTAPRDDLRLLAIFHYVLAGLAALFSLFPLIHVAVGLGLVTGKLGSGGRGGPPDLFGWIFVAFGTLFILTGLSYAVLVALAGRFLARRRNWTFCMVMAGLSCAFFPFGTVLGVFTVIVLSRSEVRVLFEPRATTLVDPGGPPPA